MADGGTAAAPDGRRRLAAVCAYLEEIRSDLRGGPDGDEDPVGPVERVLAAVRDGGDVASTLADLHGVLQAGGDPRGLDGYTDHAGSNRGVRPAGISTTRAEPVYLCPEGRCARYWLPLATAPVPHCTISSRMLRRERL